MRRKAEDGRGERKPERGRPGVDILEGHLHPLRTAVVEVGPDRGKCAARRLPRHEPHRDLRDGLARNHRLRAGPAVARVYSVHLYRRLERDALRNGLSHLPARRLASDVRSAFLLGRRARLGCGSLLVRRRLDSVAKAGDGDRSVRMVQAREELGHPLRRIRRNPAVLAGVEVAVRTRQAQREVRDAAKARDDRRTHRRRRGCIAHEQHVRGKAAAHLRRERHERAAARLLLSVEDDLDIELGALRGEVVAHSAKKREGLPLVVVRTAAVDASVLHRRLEGRRVPLGHRVRGLDVVVSVHKHRRRGLAAFALREDHRRGQRAARLLLRIDELGGESERAKPFPQPRCARNAVAQVRGVRSDGLVSQQFEVFREDFVFHVFPLK